MQTTRRMNSRTERGKQQALLTFRYILYRKVPISLCQQHTELVTKSPLIVGLFICTTVPTATGLNIFRTHIKHCYSLP